MKIINVSQANFEEINPAQQIFVDSHARRYAVIELQPFGLFGLSWHSDLIEPIIKTSESNQLTWIGVDQRIVALRHDRGTVHLALPLTYSLLEILVSESATIAVTELEVLAFNCDASLRFTKGLPDIATKVSLFGNELLVSCLDGTTLGLDVKTGRKRELSGHELAALTLDMEIGQ